MDAITLWVQVAAVIAAVGAAIVALIIASRDRQNARQIAEQDRRVALRQQRLMFEMEALVRLLQNARRGGSTDPIEVAQLGAEAAALIGLIGPDRLPLSWDRRVGMTDDEMREFVNDDTKQPFLRSAAEVQLELRRVLEEISDLSAEPPH